ncbi:DUF4400 domain-containing protein [Neisseria sp. Ec49-e6-T10]|uniref:DUF4400 domain-containing protein n=1 Tax=Neisseria sp. Ec49-e6-T10 TaxID=3140744 RepID=UPI003EBF4275
MASDSGYFLNSIALKFLIQPFKVAGIILFIVCIVFGTSIITQSYFSTESLLEQEVRTLEMTSGYSSILDSENEENSPPINVIASRYAYFALSTVFFEWTQINKALKAQTEGDSGYVFKQKYLVPHIDLLKQFDQTIKLISIRMGYLAFFGLFTLIIILIAVIDGFVARAIRQKNAGRESAGIYHRAKYWRSGIIWLSIVIYLAMPITISPILLIIPCTIFALLVWLQAKFLKKYL